MWGIKLAKTLAINLLNPHKPFPMSTKSPNTTQKQQIKTHHNTEDLKDISNTPLNIPTTLSLNTIQPYTLQHLGR